MKMNYQMKPEMLEQALEKGERIYLRPRITKRYKSESTTIILPTDEVGIIENYNEGILSFRINGIIATKGEHFEKTVHLRYENIEDFITKEGKIIEISDKITEYENRRLQINPPIDTSCYVLPARTRLKSKKVYEIEKN